MSPVGRGGRAVAKRRNLDIDLVAIIDLTMKQADVIRAAEIIRGVARHVGQLGLVLFSDHKDVPSRVGARNTERSGPDVLALPLSADVDGSIEWLDEHLCAVDSRYADAALECALRAACGMSWRSNAKRRVLLIGSALPHDARVPGIVLKTGVPCPAGVSWYEQLQQIRHQGIEIAMAMVRIVDNPDSLLFQLQESVWRQMNANILPALLHDGFDAHRWVAPSA